MNFTPRISRAYLEISGGYVAVGSDVKRMLVCQHDADEEVNRTHCHALFYNTLIKDEALKRRIKKATKLDLKGNEDWSWVSKLPSTTREEFWEDAEPVSKDELEIWKYVRYMIKGDKNTIVMSQNIPQTFIDKAAGSWEPAKVKLETVMVFEKVKKIPYQQDVIAGASAEWKKYKDFCKANGDYIDKKKIIDIVCDEMRRVSKGINPYLVKELAYAVLYDDLDFREVVLERIKYIF